MAEDSENATISIESVNLAKPVSLA